MRKEHKVYIIQALTVQYICIFQVPFPFNVNKLCSDKICLEMGQAILEGLDWGGGGPVFTIH